MSTPSTPDTVPTESRRARVFVLVCLILLALNLRAAVGSVGVLLSAIRDDLGMSATVGGVLTTLPVVCFALVGLFANDVVRKVGLHRTAALSAGLIVAGLVIRGLVHDSTAFLLASFLALAGSAIGNVILPPLVKLHFPDRIAAVSAAYGAAIMAGASLSATLTVPIADQLGSYRAGLEAWAVLGVITLVPWLWLSIRDVHVAARESSRLTFAAVARSPLAWAMAVFFGCQSAQAYAQFGWLPEIFTDAGLSDGTAGLMQGLLSGIGIPITLALPYLIGRVGDRPYLPWTFGVVTIVGWAGVLLWPTGAPWLWAILLGIGGAAFTWILTMIGKRTRTHDGTAALSSFAQGLGYLLAAVGPFGTGFLHDLTDSWTPPILMMMGIALGIIVLGTVIAKPRALEDTLPRP